MLSYNHNRVSAKLLSKTWYLGWSLRYQWFVGRYVWFCDLL